MSISRKIDEIMEFEKTSGNYLKINKKISIFVNEKEYKKEWFYGLKTIQAKALFRAGMRSRDEVVRLLESNQLGKFRNFGPDGVKRVMANLGFKKFHRKSYVYFEKI